MPPKKKKRACPFSSSTPRPKKTTKSFSKDWASKLAESDKGSYYNQGQWPEDEKAQKPIETTAESVATSASRSKIQIEVRDEKRDVSPATEETWQRLNGRAIVSGEKLQEKLQEAVCCRFCQGNVEILENLSSKSGLGSTWLVRCDNENCLSQITNDAFSTTEKIEQGRAFEVNCSSVVGFRAIGGGYSAASKVFSFLGLAPINKNSWTDHTKKIEERARILLETELNRAAREVKEWKFSNGELDCSLEELDDTVVDAGVTIDASWSSRGWSATDAVVAAISADTGKVVDVVHMSSSCTECKRMQKKKAEENLSQQEYLAWFNRHEPNCYVNHEGSPAVSCNISYHKLGSWHSYVFVSNNYGM